MKATNFLYGVWNQEIDATSYAIMNDATAEDLYDRSDVVSGIFPAGTIAAVYMNTPGGQRLASFLEETNARLGITEEYAVVRAHGTGIEIRIYSLN